MTTKTTTSRINALRAMTLLAALAGTAGLSACNTMRGAGQDVSSVGHDMSRGASSAQGSIARGTGASSN
ncbi:entericidin A/B family lipoprotein [Tanticharoenia sakaeratensis]|uniref:entericidin A/B family lipoprotein n=1 Tax=Tanticharoenia sakaeratensis TaxID=444053 RepID=UPI000B03D678|nr:entericidin A/B family lipoprotein [Tanticharoenia sakaeratensis]